MYVSLSKLPTPPQEHVLELSKLDGGLNLWDLDYRMDANQSPDMKNLYWLDGALSCRDGQVWLSADTGFGVGYSCCSFLFWGNAFFHIGSKLYRAEVSADQEYPIALTELLDGIPQNRGTWFRYGDNLYYKNRGGYYCIKYSGTFSAQPMEAYVPIIQVNTDPATGAGDIYQPENRISPQKIVWYTAVEGVKEYHLPVQGVGSVDKVVVDGGSPLAEGTDYTVKLDTGVITFTTAPETHTPVRANTVEITYTKANVDAYNSIMDCPYAVAFGGNQSVCVVVGGCTAQPNAYFWSGNHIVMDPGYFPMEQYNLAGDTEEGITGFGKQQAMLVIFKQHSIGRAAMETTEMDTGRVLISMPYTNINSRIGCDLPWTIELVENNLVFCNTEQGACIVKDSSAAYENNIVPLSRNVNGSIRRPGLLELVRTADTACSFDDGSRYWVVAAGEAYVWDYQLSSYQKPSWFYFTNINGVSFFSENEHGFHLDASGRVTAFRRTYSDYGSAIKKTYRFAAQAMGGYDTLKDVLSVIFVSRADTNTLLNVTYLTDYEERKDPTPIYTVSWRLVPRDLTFRSLNPTPFATVARRRPGCRHVRHFSMMLENDSAGTDMSVISAQIFYRYQGRDR